jgi:predicted protein tyrosine phosphatase
MERFGKLLDSKRLVVLRIRDDYAYMQPELVRILRKKVAAHLPGIVV